MERKVQIRIQASICTLFLLVICLATMSGCLDEISVNLPSGLSDRIVIEGVAERSPDDYRFLISVSRTKTLVDPVLNLEEGVMISLLFNGSEIVNLTNGQPWVSPIDVFHNIYGGISGQGEFNIRVETSEGQIFESEPQKILDPPVGGSISYELEERSVLNELENLVDRSFIKIKVNTPVVNSAGERVSMTWNATGVYIFAEGSCTTDIYGSPRRCYVSEFFGGSIANVLQSNQVDGNQVDGFEILETTASPQFSFGYYLTLVRRTISQEAGIYWNELQKSQQREGTIFDSPAGTISSNIRQISGITEPVLGYFYTAGIDTLRQFGSREDGGFQPLYCTFNPFGHGCCDCRELPFSTTKKPPYWK